MKKTQLEMYKKRYLKLKNIISKNNYIENPHFNRLLKAAESSLKKLNKNYLAEETYDLSKKQLELILTTLESNLN